MSQGRGHNTGPGEGKRTETDLCPALVEVVQVPLDVLSVIRRQVFVLNHPVAVGVDGVQALLSGGDVVLPVLKPPSAVTTTLVAPWGVCVRQREKEGERERQRKTDRDRVRKRERERDTHTHTHTTTNNNNNTTTTTTTTTVIQ